MYQTTLAAKIMLKQVISGKMSIELDTLEFHSLHAETNARIYFQYKGSLDKTYHDGSVDCKIDENVEFAFQTKEQSLMTEANEILGCMITLGIIDAQCEHRIDDFRTVRVELNPSGEADFKL